jgi:hypothetical protein
VFWSQICSIAISLFCVLLYLVLLKGPSGGGLKDGLEKPRMGEEEVLFYIGMI